MYGIDIQPIETFWESLLYFIPNLVIAILIFVVGWFLAVGIAKLITGILTKIKFNSFFESKGWKKAMEKAELEVNISEFIGSIIKWILIIVVLWMSVERLGWGEFAEVMKDIVAYLPNVIVAAFIFVVAVIVADFLSKIIVATTEKADFAYTNFAGTMVKWAIWLFAIFAILIQLGIAPELLQTLFEGIIYMFAIAGGLAFGLGGQYVARDVLEKVKKKLK